MIRVLACAVFLLSSVPAFSMPQFLELYRKDPFRNPNVDGCNTCHMSPQGGDERNAFGQAFEKGGEQITPLLRAQFPDRFVYPISRVSDALTVHFSDPDKKQVVVEAGGAKNLVDVDRTMVNGTPATNTTSPTRITTAATSQAPASEIRVDRDAREGAFFGANIVNLPNGKPQRKGGVDFFIGHRFSQNISDAGLAGLFGFDSSATVAYGVRAGITDRLSVSVFRSNYFKTISLGSALQISRQSASVPVTLQFRLGVDGLNNFGLYDKDENPTPRQYSPFLQVVATRTFKDRLSVSMVPIVAFNTKNNARVIPELALGGTKDYTAGLGVGAGYRFLRTTSIVGEYMGRLSGFRSVLRNTPGLSKDLQRISVGLQKSTFRHTFELVVSRQEPMTPAFYSYQGADTFRIGFNIYRKLR
jgi:hypothetical protein